MNNPPLPNDYQAPYGHQFDDDSVDFKRYLSLFISNWYWFATALLFALTIAYAMNRYSEEIYTVSSTMLIKENQEGSGASSLTSIFPGADVFKSEQNLNNEIGILQSFSLNYRVMQELPDFHVVYIGVGKRGIVESRMYKNSPFKVVCDSIEEQNIGVRVTIRILSSNQYELEIDGDDVFSKTLNFGERFNERGFDFTIHLNSWALSFDPDASNKFYFYFVSPVALANQYRSILNVSPIQEEATLVVLSVSGAVPDQGADYLNKLMDVYLRQGLELKNQKAEKTIEFIDGQIGSISDSLRKVESNLENFRLSNKIINLSDEGAIIQNRLTTFENELTTLNLQKKYYEYLQEYISTKNETGDLISPGALGVNNPSLEGLVTELATLQQQKNKLEVNLFKDLPAITFLDNGIIDLKSRIIENIGSSMRSLENVITDVKARISGVESEVSKLPGTERSLINIQRKFDLNNTVYTYLLEKKAEAGIARASTVSDNRVIDFAESFNSTMISPKYRQNYAMALAFGLFIPVLLIFLIDFLNNRIIDKKDVEKGTSAPIIGYIGHNQYKTEIPVNTNPGSTLSESFRSVRTGLKYFVRDNEKPVIAISSTISSEGKTFISVNLASIIAMLDKKVLLIGLDLRKPRIHKVLGVDNGIGMSTYLSGDNQFEEIIQSTSIENLFYAPSGPVPPNPAELIETTRMKDFIEKAKSKFDYVIIDTPPIAIVTDALLIAPYIDMYLIVVRQRYTLKNTLSLLQELYKNGTLKNLALVINDISLSGYYGYGLRYGYSMGYGYNYGYNYYGQGNYGKYGYADKTRGYYTEE